MAKRKDFSKFQAPAQKTGTNFRIKLTIGKTLERATVQDGFGLAPNQAEAESRFENILKRTWGVLSAELYYENHLIKKR